MSTWTIQKRIVSGFVSILVIALALGTFAYSRLAIVSEHSQEIASQSLPTIETVFQIQKVAKEQVQLIYKHIGSNDKADMAMLEKSLSANTAENAKLYEQLDQLVNDAQGQALFDKVKKSRAENNRIRAQVLQFSQQTTNSVQAYNLARTLLDPAQAQYVTDLDAMINFCRTHADQASEEINGAAISSKNGILAGLTLALIIGFALAFIIIRSTGKILNRVAGELQDGSNQVSSAAGQVSSASQTLAEGAGEQAASLEETSSSLEELSSMTKRNAENAQKANELAKQARSAADKGVTDMTAMNAAMAAIKDSSDDITKIIKTIDEIAFQTNILALNAAVEAARAGEAGMGFAVVADEVRTLAQRSAQAAKETAAKIEGAINKTAQGVGISQKVSETLNQIVLKAREVDELAAEVASASREQTNGITQINSAVGQMDKVTQSNAASAEESAAAAEELNSQAECMRHSVGELLALVGKADTRISGGAPVKPARAQRSETPVHKVVKPVKSAANGHVNSAPELASAQNGIRRNEIPLEGDFKDF